MDMFFEIYTLHLNIAFHFGFMGGGAFFTSLEVKITRALEYSAESSTSPLFECTRFFHLTLCLSVFQ